MPQYGLSPSSMETSSGSSIKKTQQSWLLTILSILSHYFIGMPRQTARENCCKKATIHGRQAWANFRNTIWWTVKLFHNRCSHDICTWYIHCLEPKHGNICTDLRHQRLLWLCKPPMPSFRDAEKIHTTRISQMDSKLPRQARSSNICWRHQRKLKTSKEWNPPRIICLIHSSIILFSRPPKGVPGYECSSYPLLEG